MTQIRLILFIAALWVCFACVEHQSVVPLLQQAEELMVEKPDSALRVLESASHTKILLRSNRAKYALLYSQALDKNYIDVDRDTLIRIATDFYSRRGASGDRAQAFFYSGRVYENAGVIDTAIMQYTKAEYFVRATDDNYLKGLIANALAGLYATQQFRAFARSKYREAATYFMQIGHKKNAFYSYRGVISLSGTDIDSTIHFEDDLALTEQLALELKDTIYLRGLARTYANQNLMNGNYEDALEIVRNNNKNYNRGHTHPDDYFILSNIYLNLNKLDSAYLYLKPLLDNLQQTQSRSNAEVHYLAGKLMKQKGDYRQAYEHTIKTLGVIDSTHFAEKECLIPELKEKYHNEQLSLHNEYLRTINRYQIYIIILVLIGVLIIIMWLLRRRKAAILRHHKELSNQQTAILELQKELDELKEIHESNRNDSYLSQILERRIDFIKNTLEATASFEHDKNLYYNKIKQFLRTKGNAQTNNALLLFRDMLDAKQPGILNYIQEKYADLTEEDINLYCLICLDISAPAICLVLGHKPKTIYNYRNELRGKLMIRNENISFSEHFVMNCAEQLKAKMQVAENVDDVKSSLCESN